LASKPRLALVSVLDLSVGMVSLCNCERTTLIEPRKFLATSYCLTLSRLPTVGIQAAHGQRWALGALNAEVQAQANR
jgi:hypothetical protein